MVLSRVILAVLTGVTWKHSPSKLEDIEYNFPTPNNKTFIEGLLLSEFVDIMFAISFCGFVSSF